MCSNPKVVEAYLEILLLRRLGGRDISIIWELKCCSLVKKVEKGVFFATHLTRAQTVANRPVTGNCVM